MYIYSWKKIDKSLTHFGDALCKKYIFLHVKCSHVVVQLYNGVTSPCIYILIVIFFTNTNHPKNITQIPPNESPRTCFLTLI